MGQSIFQKKHLAVLSLLVTALVACSHSKENQDDADVDDMSGSTTATAAAAPADPGVDPIKK
jgi:hypothetical protein